MYSFDVAIAGGGPAGAATALKLARQGRRVLLANAASSDAFRVGEGLPPSARSLLRELGVLEQFLADGHRISYGNVSVWGSSVPQTTDFIVQWHGHGFQLDRARFDAMLRAAARKSGAQVQEETRITVLRDNRETSDNEGIRLQLAGKGMITEAQCRWLVDAGGRPATLSRRLGAKRQPTDHLIAFYGILESNHMTDQDGRTLIEACADGWWYSVLLPSSKRLVAYLTDLDLADRNALLSKEGFLAKLSNTGFLQDLLLQHGYSLTHPPHGADASSGCLNRYGGDRWLAVGDAALSFDPLSSQGILNALYTGLKAGQTLHAALAGDSEAPESYASHLAQIYQAYLHNRASFYAYENRWTEHTFWKRRRMVV